MGAQHCRPSGLRIKSAMTARGFLIIWIPAYAGMTVQACGYCLKVSMTGAWYYPSGLRIKSAMTARGFFHHMDSRLRGNDVRF